MGANDGPGGAGKAALRICQAVNQFSSVDATVTLRTIKSSSNDDTGTAGYPETPLASRAKRFSRVYLRKVSRAGYRILGGRSVFSTAEIRTGLGDEFARRDIDLLVLNWLGDFTISLEEIDQLSVPLLAILHDEWLFLGARHFAPIKDATASSNWQRILDAIFINSRDRLTRERKLQLLYPHLSGLVYPGGTVPDHISAAARLHSVPVHQIPYPFATPALDVRPREEIRDSFHMSAESLVIGFGGDKAEKDPRKGLGILLSSIRTIAASKELKHRPLEVHIFGASRARETTSPGFRVVYHRFLSQERLNQFFQSIDLFAFPSSAETFGNVVLEAQANGCPAIAFDVGGVSMQVQDGISGFIVQEKSFSGFLSRMREALEVSSTWPEMGKRARQKIADDFSEKSIAQQYLDLFQRILT